MATIFYHCPHCGKVIVQTVAAQTPTICCGEPMQVLVAKTKDQMAEKHVPVVERPDRYTLLIRVGSEAHPMTPDHHICWVALESENGVQIRYLHPTQTLRITMCDTHDVPLAVYAYCNLHGLWMTEEIPMPASACSTRKPKGCFGSLLFLMCMLLFPWTACSSGTMIDNTPVPSLDLQRYLGKWYEIARYDHRFERDMQNCTALYTMNDDGTIRVTNSGIVDGKRKESIGKAKTTGTPGLLRVSFFGPFYSDYRVLMLSEDYSYALIGSASEKYLWILARTPVLPDASLQRLLQEAARRGYDTTGLIWVDQQLSIESTEPDTPDAEMSCCSVPPK